MVRFTGTDADPYRPLSLIFTLWVARVNAAARANGLTYSSLIDGLNRAHAEGGAARAVLGDYGFGKSHAVELTGQIEHAVQSLLDKLAVDSRGQGQ